jgi:hypothetical protein
VANITMGAGALIAAGGLAWYFWNKPSDSNPPATAVRPVVGPDSVGVVATGRF